MHINISIAVPFSIIRTNIRFGVSGRGKGDRRQRKRESGRGRKSERERLDGGVYFLFSKVWIEYVGPSISQTHARVHSITVGNWHCAHIIPEGELKTKGISSKNPSVRQYVVPCCMACNGRCQKVAWFPRVVHVHCRVRLSLFPFHL